MKKFLLIAALIFLAACSETKSEELSSSSPEGKFSIKIYGTKATSMDPFQTRIIMSGNDMTDTLVTEVFASGLTKETVKFNWTDSENCQITLEQTDKPRVLSASFSGGGLRLSDSQ